MASRAIPSHLKPSAAEGKGEGGFNSQRHHGKSQSHVVSYLPCSFGDCNRLCSPHIDTQSCFRGSSPSASRQAQPASVECSYTTGKSTPLATRTIDLRHHGTREAAVNRSCPSWRAVCIRPCFATGRLHFPLVASRTAPQLRHQSQLPSTLHTASTARFQAVDAIC